MPTRRRRTRVLLTGEVAAAPIQNDFLAVRLPPQQEVDGAEQATVADEVDLEVEEALLKQEFSLRIGRRQEVPRAVPTRR